MKKSNGKIINLGSGIGTSVSEITEIRRHFYKSNSKINATGNSVLVILHIM